MSTDNFSGFNTSVDPLTHKDFKNKLHAGIPREKSNNMVLESLALFEGVMTDNFLNAVSLFDFNILLEAAGNFNRARGEQNNKADMRASDIFCLISGAKYAGNKIMEYLARGHVIGPETSDLIMHCLERVGGAEAEDKLKVGKTYNFVGVKITHMENDETTGLIYFRFQYTSCRIEEHKFDMLGVDLGLQVTEIRLQDNSPGKLL
jgi:hypothetical protein